MPTCSVRPPRRSAHRRCTTASPGCSAYATAASRYWPTPVPAEVRARLIEAARAENGWLDLLVGMTALSGFAEIAQSADRVLRRDARYQSELVGWARADAADDGVPVWAGASSPEPQDL